MRFQVKYMVGKMFGGSKVLALRVERPPSSNAPVWYVGFACRKCGVRAEASSSACTQWTAKRLPWRCAECRAKDRHDAAAKSRILASTLETQAVRNLVLRSDGAKRYYRGEADCVLCGEPVVGKIKALRAMERTHGIRCDGCHRATKKVEVSPSKRSVSGKIPMQTLQALDALPVRVQEIARRAIREHLAACLRARITVEDLNRVYVEAIEVAKLEAEAPVRVATGTSAEPFRQYGQYISPRAD